MREIKFRAWHFNNKIKGSNEFMIYSDEYDNLSKFFTLQNRNHIFMQYTGLKDKNGKEIYEGDICNMHIFTQELGENLGVFEGEKEMIVKISINISGVMVNDEPLFVYLNESFHDMSEPFEIIGNIHENPELL